MDECTSPRCDEAHTANLEVIDKLTRENERLRDANNDQRQRILELERQMHAPVVWEPGASTVGTTRPPPRPQQGAAPLPSTCASSVFPFLDLPTELRRKVYRFLLAWDTPGAAEERDPIRPDVTATHGVSRTQLLDVGAVNFFLSCKQIHQGAEDVLYANTFRFSAAPYARCSKHAEWSPNPADHRWQYGRRNETYRSLCCAACMANHIAPSSGLAGWKHWVVQIGPLNRAHLRRLDLLFDAETAWFYCRGERWQPIVRSPVGLDRAPVNRRGDSLARALKALAADSRHLERVTVAMLDMEPFPHWLHLLRDPADSAVGAALERLCARQLGPAGEDARRTMDLDGADRPGGLRTARRALARHLGHHVRVWHGHRGAPRRRSTYRQIRELERLFLRAVARFVRCRDLAARIEAGSDWDGLDMRAMELLGIDKTDRPHVPHLGTFFGERLPGSQFRAGVWERFAEWELVNGAGL